MTNTGSKTLKAVLAVLVPFIVVSSSGARVIDETIATVNGKPILLSEYNKNKDSVLEQYRKGLPDFFEQEDAMEQIESKVLDQMIDDAVLLQHAEKLKIKIRERELENGMREIKRRFTIDAQGKPVGEKEADAAFQRELRNESLSRKQFEKRIRNQLMIRKVIDESIRPKITPPEESEVRGYYDKIDFIIKGNTSVVKGMKKEDADAIIALAQRSKDLTAERVRVRHILIKMDETTSMVDKSKLLEKALGIKKRIDKGEDFSELAGKYSDDAESALRGGDLGFIIRNWMVDMPEFEKVAFSLGVGKTSRPVETKFGYHIIRVEEKRAAQKLVYENIKEDLTQYIAGRQMQKELIAFIKDLRSKSTIKINIPAGTPEKEN